MKTLRECIAEAAAAKRAVGHFNVSTADGAWAIFRAAKAAQSPVIIGVSEGERSFLGVRQAAAFVRSIREEYGHPVFMNADHTYSFEKVREAVDAGYDAVIFDGTELSYEENLKETKRCVAYARESGRDIIVEGELGFIGKSSKVLDALPEGVAIAEEHLTKPDDAKRFVAETGVDLLAPAVGNIHGMLKSGIEPALNVRRVKEIREAAGVPLVLHGASGNTAEDVGGAVSAGAAVVHVNTELRLAYRNALTLSLQENPEELAPYKYLKGPMQAMEKVVEEKLKIFSRR